MKKKKKKTHTHTHTHTHFVSKRRTPIKRWLQINPGPTGPNFKKALENTLLVYIYVYPFDMSYVSRMYPYVHVPCVNRMSVRYS